MLRKFVCAAFVAAVVVSLAAADEFGALIHKVEGGKVTFFKMKKGEKGEKGSKGDEETLPVAENVKVVNAKFNKEEKKVEAGEALEGGLQNERFKNSEKGVFAQIVTNDGKVTEIRVFNFKGFGKKKKDNN